MNPLNLALVPKSNEWEKFIELSEMFGKRNNSRFILGHRSIPHVTLLQFDWNDSLDELWMRIAPKQDSAITLDLMGLCFVPSREGELWVEIPIKKTNLLVQSQVALLEKLELPVSAYKNGIADDYRPHITIGLIDLKDRPSMPVLEYDTLRQKALECHVCLGQSGANFELTQIIRGGTN